MFWKACCAALILFGLGAETASAQTYKAERDFSYLNPAGVWAYGRKSIADGTVTKFGPMIDGCLSGLKVDCFRDGESLVSLNTGPAPFAVGTVLLGEGVLMMHPGVDSHTLVTFKAPKAGTYKFEGLFQILDSSPTSVAPKIFAGARDITLLAFNAKAPVVLTGPGANLTTRRPGQTKRFKFDRTLPKNGVITFLLDANGDWRFDTTGFNVTVTPPAN